MVTLSTHALCIKIVGSTNHVVSTFLRVFLANSRLTDKQLEVTAALVERYTEYSSNGVKEPYASTILFSTEVRKDICKELKISPAHLNNTFNALTKKTILAKEGVRYLMNPSIIPTDTLTFEFNINDKQG